MAKDQAVYDGILRDIDSATEPDKMSKKEAHEWLDELISDLESRAEALKDEMGDEDEDDD